MQYFILSEKTDIPNKAKLLAVTDNPQERRQIFDIEEAADINDMSIIFAKDDENSIYPDVIDTPVFLVSDKLRKVLQMYEDGLVFKGATLVGDSSRQQFQYWLTLMERVECLTETAEFDEMGYLQKPVIDASKIGKRRIFRIDGINEHVVVINLDTAESILRRFCSGVKLTPVQLV